MRAKLEVISGAKPTSIVLRLPTVIGRSGSAKIKLPASTVSRHHCEIYEYDRQIAVRDLGSSNGTVVNGQRIAGPTFLTADDDLRIGPVTMHVSVLPEPASLQSAGVGQPLATDDGPPSHVGSDNSANDKRDLPVENDNQPNEIQLGEPQADVQPACSTSVTEQINIVANASSPDSDDDDGSFLSYAENAQGGFVDVVEAEVASNAQEPQAADVDKSTPAIDTGHKANLGEQEIPVFDPSDASPAKSVDDDDTNLKNFFNNLE